MRGTWARVTPLLSGTVLGVAVALVAAPALRVWLLGEEFGYAAIRGVSPYEWWLRSFAVAGCVAVGAAISWHVWRGERIVAERDYDRELLRLLVDRLPDQIYAKDRHGRFALANPSTVQALGAPSESAVLGRTEAELGRDWPAGQLAALEEQLRSGGEGVVALPCEFAHAGGASECFLATKLPIRDRAGRLAGIVGINHSVTALHSDAEQARAGAEWLRAILENVAVGVVVTDTTQTIRMTNGRIEEMLGYRPGDLVGRSLQDLVHPDDRSAAIADMSAVARQIRTGYRRERRYLTSTGESVWVEVSGTIARDPDGAEIGRVVVFLDITARRAAEEALRKERDFGREVLETIGSLVVVLDTDGRIVVFNRACEECTGYLSEEVLGRRMWDFLVAPDEAEAARATFATLRVDGSPAHIENHWVTRGGERRLIVWSNSVVREAQGSVEFVLSTGIDVTEHRKAEEERQRLFTLSLDMLCVAGLDGRLRQVNPAWTRSLGWSEEELRNATLIDLVHPEDRPATRAVSRALFEGSPIVGFEARVRCADGSFRQLSWNAFPLLEEDLIFAVVRDVTELRRTERVVESIIMGGSAQVGERFFESMVLQLASALGADYAIIGEMTDGGAVRTISVCAHGAVIDDFEFDLVGTPSEGVLVNGLSAYASGVIEHFPNDPALRQWQIEGYVGVPLFDSQGEPIGILSALYQQPVAETGLAVAVLRTFAGRTAAELERRRTEEQRRRFERQVQQSQRLESLGVLAGGVAHDFNNVLGAVIGYTELSLAMAGGGTPLAANLNQVLSAATPARELVKQILTFTRHVTQDKQVVAVPPIVDEALRFLRSSLPATIDIRVQVDRDCGPVRADATQLHQVIVNLCTNAHYAMRTSGGILEVRLENVLVDPLVAAGLGGVAPGRYARLSVADTGCGMDEATRERIFEPFYTTKAPGEGTGLGLAVTHGIVSSHCGAITVYSEPGQGSTFRVYLPQCEGAPVEDAVAAGPIVGGSERVLVVDDEASLAEMDEQILTTLGYEVARFTSGPEALEAFLREPDRYDLIATDQTMPGITGLEMAQRVHAVRPELPVLLVTGFSHTVNEPAVLEAGADLVLMKPYTVRQFAEAVRGALDEASSRALEIAAF